MRPRRACSASALFLAGVVSTGAAVQRPAVAAALVFDSVTIVDVEQGKLLPGRRVVITGNRIQAIGSPRAVSLPRGAQVVNARGKYLIPGLWDMHVHLSSMSSSAIYMQEIIAGVTGIRDPGSTPPLDTLLQWRREILAGTRVGPPRQIFSGKTIEGPEPGCVRDKQPSMSTCVIDAADARHLVDSLQAAGADMIKPREVSPEIYFALAAEARRLGIPFGGHATYVTTLEASDSGARIIDHASFARSETGLRSEAHPCLARTPSDNVEKCRPVAERFRRNGTWWVPTLSPSATSLYYNGELFVRARFGPAFQAFRQRIQKLWRLDVDTAGRRDTRDAGPGLLSIAHETGLPILAGTDRDGYSLHLELAMYVAEGLTPLEALQTATLNPAKFLRATDSLGTVASGKLADLVLLDADPLADIANTMRIRAVVANGRYYDRAALDQMWTEILAAP